MKQKTLQIPIINVDLVILTGSRMCIAQYLSDNHLKKFEIAPRFYWGRSILFRKWSNWRISIFVLIYRFNREIISECTNSRNLTFSLACIRISWNRSRWRTFVLSSRLFNRIYFRMFFCWTDGSYQPSTNTGGWGSIIVDKDNNIIKKLYRGYKNTTNNRQELYGVLETLKYFKTPTELTIYSDSQYVVNSINAKHLDKWIAENDLTKKNLDLWNQIYKLLQFHKVTFVWVKGHNDNKFNELADLYAVHSANCLDLLEDVTISN